MTIFARTVRTAVLALAIGAATTAAASQGPDIRRETYWYTDESHTVVAGHGIIFCDNTTQSWGSKTEYVVSYVYTCA